MFEPFGEDHLRVLKLLWIAFVAIAVIGWAFLDWERGAGFESQPISFALGVVGFLVAITVVLWRQVAD